LTGYKRVEESNRKTCIYYTSYFLVRLFLGSKTPILM